MYLNKRGSTTANIAWLILLIVLVVIQATGTLLMKQVAVEFASYLDIFTNALFLLVLLMIVIRAVCWPVVLHHIELSFANAMGALVPLLVLVGAHFIFGERIEVNHLIGGSFIALGIVLFFSDKKR